MSELGWIGKKILAGIEAIPTVEAGVERQERITPILGAAKRAACGPPDDPTAKATLANELAGKRDLVVEALNHSPLLAQRAGYINDRAYRLLAAIAADSDVETIPAWRASLFREEEVLGRMPMEEAFKKLAGIEPRLADVERLARERVTEDDDTVPNDISQRLRTLVGSRADRDSDLLRTGVASGIAHHHLWILLGERAFGRPNMSYFDAPRK